MAAPTAADLAALLGPDLDVDTGQANAVLSIVTALAKSHTRDNGFDDDGVPNADVRAVILTASARLLAHPRQSALGETLGPQSATFGSGFQGWSLVEQSALNRYRERAQ
jgi:hypothetical protein